MYNYCVINITRIETRVVYAIQKFDWYYMIVVGTFMHL